MRTSRTFILRLLVDTEDPTAVRGALRAVGEPQERAFSSPARLLEILQHAGEAETRSAPQDAAFETQPSIPTVRSKEDRSCNASTLIS